MTNSRCDQNRGHCNEQNNYYKRNIIDPFEALGTIFIDTFGKEFANNVKDVVSKGTGNFKVKMDIFEDHNNYNIVAEIPGVTKEDIKIVINNDDVLEISGNKKEIISDDKEKTKLQTERKFGEFIRTIAFGKKIDKEKINAKFSNGELNITIAKAEEEKPKQVAISID